MIENRVGVEIDGLRQDGGVCLHRNRSIRGEVIKDDLTSYCIEEEKK